MHRPERASEDQFASRQGKREQREEQNEKAIAD